MLRYFLLLLLILLAGCSDGRPSRVPVSGKVTIDGRPLTAGVIRVIPAGAKPATGNINPDGTFQLTTFDPQDGCVTGKHGVEIISRKTTESGDIQWLTPAKYREAATSGLQVEIEGPRDDLLIELTWGNESPRIESGQGDAIPGE